MKTTTPTLQSFLKGLESQNKTLASWARDHGFSVGEVYSLSRGRTMGRRGQAREILKAMGVEPPPMFRAEAARTEGAAAPAAR